MPVSKSPQPSSAPACARAIEVGPATSMSSHAHLSAPALKTHEPPPIAFTLPPPVKKADQRQRQQDAETTRLLLDYLDPSYTLAHVAVRNDISLFDLLEWLARPEVVAALTCIQAAEVHRVRLLNSAADELATQALLRVIDSHNPETTRRAAAALLRHTRQGSMDPRHAKAPGAGGARPASSHEPGDPPHQPMHTTTRPASPAHATIPEPPPPAQPADYTGAPPGAPQSARHPPRTPHAASNGSVDGLP